MAGTRRRGAELYNKRKRRRLLYRRDLETLANPEINMRSRRWRRLERAREWCEWYDEQHRQRELWERRLNVFLLSAGVVGLFSPDMFYLFVIGCMARLTKCCIDDDKVRKHFQARLEMGERLWMPYS